MKKPVLSALALIACQCVVTGCVADVSDSAYAASRSRMVDSQIEARGITDERVLNRSRWILEYSKPIDL